MLAYFKSHWPEEVVPPDCPLTTYWEVETDRDVVTRMVDVFADGRAIRDSMELAKREGFDARPPEFRSLVHGEFLTAPPEYYDGDPLEAISEATFLEFWNRATDKPWP